MPATSSGYLKQLCKTYMAGENQEPNLFPNVWEQGISLVHKEMTLGWRLHFEFQLNLFHNKANLYDLELLLRNFLKVIRATKKLFFFSLHEKKVTQQSNPQPVGILIESNAKRS